ncbi:hypothetical protein LCGC14_3008980 [marine sediment metagenome]|uniref:Uncharacterized protein n=1 Tax=marine sediment metagenome TaxID=412755 RepID=A0A0F8WZ89_9ZZZZ
MESILGAPSEQFIGWGNALPLIILAIGGVFILAGVALTFSVFNASGK